MCLVSFVAGLAGVFGRQIRYAYSNSLHKALNLALSVDEADKQERRNESLIPT